MEKINYLELAAENLPATKKFFTAVFDWQFTDYGPEYSAFSASSAGLDGGFYTAPLRSTTETGGALVVFYSEMLDVCKEKVLQNGGELVKDTFEFPGGRRFHFKEPSGNEFAVWSDK